MRVIDLTNLDAVTESESTQIVFISKYGHSITIKESDRGFVVDGAIDRDLVFRPFMGTVGVDGGRVLVTEIIPLPKPGF